MVSCNLDFGVRVETGGASGLDDGLEIPVICVAEHEGKVAAGPEFVSRRIGAADFLKGCDFVTHGFRFRYSSFVITLGPPV